MDRLILLCGASGSGKTTISKELEGLGYNIIYSYTTREPRSPNEWGHRFTDLQELQATRSEDIIAYQQVYAGLHYWATKWQYRGLGDSIYVVCPDGAREVQERLKFDDVEIITIYLQADEYTRWARMSASRPPQDVEDRLKVDNEKYQVVKCDYTVDGNQDLAVVVSNIQEILERN